ncbi:hypothetical protein [Agromyces fucosus]|uniref:hypothetical protein n=1 Tax=Agromyces fucosus TaxID=41985 RepID=UPI001A9D613F|nr:hypothetical protein [Agromyces fucosus]
MRNTRALRVAATMVGALALTLAVGALPAQAAQPDFICEPLDSGKIDTTGSPATVTVTAPAGQLIDGYCVKAGTTKYFVPVVPPQATVVIDHPDKDSVSHYSYSYFTPTTPDPEKLAIPGDPAWADKCGTDADGFTLPSDTDDIDWSTTGLVGGIERLTATVKGTKTFTDGATTKTFEHVFTDEDCDPTTETATLDGSVATGVCEADSPWIHYNVKLTDPEGTVTNRTVSLVMTDGTNTETIVLGDLKSDGTLEGKKLWPGASVDAEGKANGWPGWALVDGKWVETDGNFAWTRGITEAKLVVNPETAVTISYPEATPVCATGPEATPPGGGNGSTALAETGFAGTSIAIVAGIIVIAGAAFLVVARIRRRRA